VAVTASQWKRTVLPLLDEPSAWAFKGKLAYRVPPGWLLRGVHGSGSSWNRDQVYVHSIYMPLFVPHSHLVLSYGRRVPNGTSAFPADRLGDPIALALSELPDERSALKTIAERRESEEGCYALLLLGKPKAALRAFARPHFPNDRRDFVEEARTRMHLVEGLLRTGTDQATEQLRQWRDETLSALGIR
jgi:hypothetical protein